MRPVEEDRWLPSLASSEKAESSLSDLDSLLDLGEGDEAAVRFEERFEGEEEGE